MQLLGQHPQGLLQLLVAHPSLKTAMAGLVRRILPRQLPPLRPGAQNPQHPVQHRARVLGRTPTPIRPSLKLQQRFQYRPLLVGDFSASSHRQFGRSSELPILSRYSAQNTSEIFAPLFKRLVLMCRHLLPLLADGPYGDDLMRMYGELEAFGPNQRQRLLISLDGVGPPCLLHL